MLQVDTESEGLEGGPDWELLVCFLSIGWIGCWVRTEVLVHGVGVIGPGNEVVLDGSELLLEAGDVGGVLVEEDLELGLLGLVHEWNCNWGLVLTVP